MMIRRDDFNRTVSALRRKAPETAANVNLVSVVEYLAKAGMRLQRRYENECSYEWADTPEYEAGTRRAEERIRKAAAAAGLQVYIQGDPRGAAVYVDYEPIPDNAYNRAFCLSFTGRDR
jgi:hypothetical protein